MTPLLLALFTLLDPNVTLFGTPGAASTPSLQFATEQNLAPMTLGVGGSYFNGVKDDTFYFGFNMAPSGLPLVPGVAKWAQQMESDYLFDAKHCVEWNVDFIATNGVAMRRFLGFRALRDDPDGFADWYFGVAGSGGWHIYSPIDMSGFTIPTNLVTIKASGEVQLAVGPVGIGLGDAKAREALEVRGNVRADALVLATNRVTSVKGKVCVDGVPLDVMIARKVREELRRGERIKR